MKKRIVYALLVGFGIGMASISYAQPLVIAHRGYSAIAPENTLSAVRRAAELEPKPAFIEIDLHRSSDGVLVVSHDTNTQRTTGIDKIIRETPFDVLRQLNAGYPEKFQEQFKGELLPRFEEVLDAVKDTPAGIMIECKQLLLEDQVVEILRKRGEVKKHIIASFDEMTVYRAKKMEPSCRTLYLAGGLNSDIIWRARDLGADIIGFNCGEKAPTIRAAQDAGFKVWVWTVDELADMQKWIDAGVDAIITNQPERALKMIHP